MANLIYQGLQPGLDEDLFGGPDAALVAAAAVGLNSADESLPYSTSELNAPEYSTDEFRMFQFKVARCSKRYVHDWRACPFAHPTENARRRDPRLVKYLPVPCPDYKRGICLRGDSCTYSHGVYECWLHPAKYRTQLCKEGPNCRRPVCFFAHSVLDLRQPIHAFQAGHAATEANVAVMMAAQKQQQAAQQQQQAAAARMSSDMARLSADCTMARLSTDSAGGGPASAASSAFARLSSEEMMNNMAQETPPMSVGRGSSDAHSTHSAAASVAAILASAGSSGNGLAAAATAAANAMASPSSRASSLTRSSSRSGGSSSGGSGGSGGSGSAGHSPDRSGSPNSPDLPAALSADAQGVSEAAAAMAVLTQQQQLQAAQAAAAQAAAALARLSVDAASARSASLDASAAAVTTRAMLSAKGGNNNPAALPPRMSLDSLLATRQQQAGWVPGQAAPATAAAQLAGGAGNSSLPLNEQPFPSGNAPRMSNAVARKLGLAPQRASLDARLSKLRGAGGGATPPRTSLDGILHALQHNSSARSSLDQHQALLQQAMSNQQQHLAMQGLANGYGPHGGMNGYGMNGMSPAPHGYMQGGMQQHQGQHHQGNMHDGAMLHPALLSLVAAQMQQHQGQHPHSQMPGGMHGMPPGAPNGMHSGDANMAALMESLHNGWQINGGGHPSGGPPHMGHRASMESMNGMHRGAQGMHGNSHGGPHAYFESKPIWASSSAQEASNNSVGVDS